MFEFTVDTFAGALYDFTLMVSDAPVAWGAWLRALVQMPLWSGTLGA